jgi:hypothetical protein
MNLIKSKRFFNMKKGQLASFVLFFLFTGFLTQLSAQVTVTISKIDPTCNTFTNGSATATATGGTAPYTYRWSNNVVGSSIFGLGGGTFSVAATDAAGRTGTASVTFNAPAPITASISFADICTGGSVTATATGGAGGYTYNWGNGRTGPTQAGLGGGSYNLTITDVNGCSSVKFVSVPAAFDVTMRVGILQCFGDCDAAIDALTSGGTGPFTYRWNTGATTQAIVGLPSGTYSVTVTDANGCTKSGTGTVANPPQIIISTNVNAPACGGGATGSATVSATGGRPPFTYRWSNGQTGATATGLNVGDYFVTVTDAGGCNRTAKVVVPSNAGFTIGINSTNASCGASNGSATASVTSGGRAPFTYKWSNNATTAAITGIPAGTYTVTVTDANGCINTASTTVNAAGSLNVNVTSTNAACGIANGTATATPTSGTAPFTYKWSNNATTAGITLLGAGTYTVTVSDASGCTAIGSATITSTNSFDVTVDARNVTCNGGSDGQLTAMVMGGSAPYTYTWSNGGNVAVIANIVAGTYTVNVRDASGCTASKTVTIIQPSAISITATVGATSCGTNNGSVTTTTSGGNAGFTYLWSNGATTANISNLAAGSYTLTVTDSKGCKSNATATVTSSNGISLTVGSTNVTCFGGNSGSASATVTGSTGTVTYAWSNGGTTASLSNLTAGSYTVTATNGGCSATQSAVVTQPTEISIGISLTNPTCGNNNGNLTASASGGTPQYSYKWSNGATTASISGLASGTYTVTVTDANGCTKMTSQAIAAPNSPSATIAQTVIRCNGASTGGLQASATGGASPYTYLWSNSATTASITGLAAGTYTVTVRDASGCTSTASSTLVDPAAIVLTTSTTNATCQPVGSARVTATGGTGTYTYAWSTGATTAQISNVAGGSYTVTVTDGNSCTKSVAVTVPATTSPNLTASATVTKPMTGNNTNDAEATVVASLGTAPYTYLWSNGATTQTIRNLAVGTYTVTVTDANGCRTSATVTIANNFCNNVTAPGSIGTNQTICNVSELQPLTELTAASGGTNADAINYLWMYSTDSPIFNTSWTPITGSTGKDLPVNLIPNLNGTTYFIRCVRRGTCSYIESNVVTITVRAFAVIEGPTTACLNQAVNFAATQNVTGATYFWNFAGANIATSSSRTPTITFTSTGVKQVILTVNVFGCQKAAVMSVNVQACGAAFGNFVGFNANPLNQREVSLDWATANEQMDSRYIVEKSADGINFTSVGTIASQMRPNSLYKFSDVAPKAGRSFYRVRQVDMNGDDVKTTESKKVMITGGTPVLTYPNPAQSSIFVEVLDADNAEGTIQIYNHIGRLVQTQQFTKDQLRYQVNTDNLASGTYILKIHRNDGAVQSVKITKL